MMPLILQQRKGDGNAYPPSPTFHIYNSQQFDKVLLLFFVVI